MTSKQRSTQCGWCHTPILTSDHRQKYCDQKCCSEAKKVRLKTRKNQPPTPTANMDWQQHAACIGVPDHVTHPEGSTQLHHPDVQLFKNRVCGGCPVKLECRAYADKHEGHTMSVHGIYGGETPAERLIRRGVIKNSRTTHCLNGHPREGNTRRNPNGGITCRACERENDRRKRARKAAERNPTPLPTQCRRGHAWPENLRVSKNGDRSCAECKRQYDRKRYHQQKRDRVPA